MLTDWGGCLQVLGVLMIVAGLLAFWPLAALGLIVVCFGFIIGIMETNQRERRKVEREDRERIVQLEAELRRRDREGH